MKKRYSSSLTDAQWKYVESKLPEEMLKRKRKWASGDFRQKQGRERSPSVGSMDSQNSKTIAISHQESGFDAGKLVKGRKRHLVVDVLGLVLAVFVHSANIQDRDGAKMLLQRLFDKRWDSPRLKVFFADGGYAGHLMSWVDKTFKKLNWVLDIVKRNEPHKFQVLPKRWVVERTFAWPTWSRRLSKDYERRTEPSEAFIHLDMIRILAIRLAKN